MVLVVAVAELPVESEVGVGAELPAGKLAAVAGAFPVVELRIAGAFPEAALASLVVAYHPSSDSLAVAWDIQAAFHKASAEVACHIRVAWVAALRVAVKVPDVFS